MLRRIASSTMALTGRSDHRHSVIPSFSLGGEGNMHDVLPCSGCYTRLSGSERFDKKTWGSLSFRHAVAEDRRILFSDGTFPAS